MSLRATPDPRPAHVVAGALSLVVVICLVISSLVLSLLLLYAQRRQQQVQQQRQLTVQRNVRSGLAYLLAETTLPYFYPVALDLYEQETDSVWLVKRPWGIFDLAVVRAATGAACDTLIALVGSQFASPGEAAVYVAEEGKPLSLVGRSQLLGDAYLPQLGVRPAYLAQPSQPSPASLLTGYTKRSTATLPLAADTALHCLRDYAQLALTTWLPPNTPQLPQVRAAHRSFYGSPLVYYQEAPLTLRNLTLTGQVLVTSAHKVTIEASAHLNNVLVLAPVIVVQSGFRGRVQLFARDTVQVQADCALLYPSAVCAYSPAGAASLLLGERSFISGVLIAATPDPAGKALVRMQPTTRVQGQVYVDGTVENCGQVEGTVACRRFRYATAASFYENYLVEATINRVQLPPSFLTSPRLNPGAAAGVTAWLR